MVTFDDVIEWLEEMRKKTWDAGVYEYDMGKEYSETADEAGEFEQAREILSDVRNSLFGERWTITRGD